MLLFLCSFCVAYLFGPTPTAYFGIFHCPASGYKNSQNYSSFRGRDKSTKHLSYFLKYCALAVAGTWVCHGNFWHVSKYSPDRPQILRQLSWQQLLIKFLWHGQCSFARLPLSSFIATSN